MDKTISERSIVALALKPQNINSSAVNGADITEPWKRGRRLRVILAAGAMTTGDALTVTVQGKKRSDGNYEAVKAAGGASNLTFTVSKTSDTGALETNGVLHGVVNISRAKLSNKYSALRISAINAVAQNVLLSGVAVIEDLYDVPSGDTDDLSSKGCEAA